MCILVREKIKTLQTVKMKDTRNFGIFSVRVLAKKNIKYYYCRSKFVLIICQRDNYGWIPSITKVV